jgi:hypothetical protein
MKTLLENFKKHLNEVYYTENDYKIGSRVSWNALERVEKSTATGRVKIDYARVSHSGEIIELYTSVGAAAGSAAIMDDETSSTYELPLSELTLIA